MKRSRIMLPLSILFLSTLGYQGTTLADCDGATSLYNVTVQNSSPQNPFKYIMIRQWCKERWCDGILSNDNKDCSDVKEEDTTNDSSKYGYQPLILNTAISVPNARCKKHNYSQYWTEYGYITQLQVNLCTDTSASSCTQCGNPVDVSSPGHQCTFTGNIQVQINSDGSCSVTNNPPVSNGSQNTQDAKWHSNGSVH